MIIANQWYNIAKTSTLGSTTGIRIEFGSYYALVRTAVDYGNIVITAVESNISEEKIKVGVRIRYNRGWFADVRISPTIDDADLKASVYENNGWTAVSPNTSTAGSTVCIINDVISQMLPSSGGESLWERVNVGTEEEPKYALVPKEYDGFKPGIVTHTFVTFGGMGSGATGEGGTGNGAVILDGLEDVQIINPTPGQVLSYDETTGLWINKSTDFVQQYVDDAVTPLSGNITTLQGYFFNGAANNALMLGGQLPEYYATATGLTALSDRVAELEKYFYFDKERNAVCVKEDYNFIVPKYITFGGLDTGSGEGGGGLSRVTIYLGETPYTSETGVVRLPAYPVIPTDISAFNNDKAYATVTEVNNAISTAVTPLSGNITTLQGYFTSGAANNALMLGGQLPEYYATATGLTALSDRVAELEKLFYYDAEHDAVRTSLSLIVDKWLTFGGAVMGSGSVTGATTLAGLNDVQITEPTDGQSLVYDATLGKWVNKAVSGGSGTEPLFPRTATKLYASSNVDDYYAGYYGWSDNINPTNFFGINTGMLAIPSQRGVETLQIVFDANGSNVAKHPNIGVRTNFNRGTFTSWSVLLHSRNYSSYALPITGGVVSGTIYTTATPGIILKRGEDKNPYLRFTNLEDVNYGEVGVTPDGSFAFWPAVSGAQGYGQWNTVLHSTNYSSYALPLSGGTISGKTTISTSGWGNQLVINRSEGNGAASIAFSNTGNGIVGYIGIGGTASSIGVKPFYEDTSGNSYFLIHSGNIGSQSVDYANSAGKISNHTISDLAVYSASISANGSNRHIGYGYATGGWLASGPAMVFGTTNGYRLFLQAYAASHSLFVNYSNGDTTKVTGSWRELAYLDSVLSLSGGTMNGTITTDATPGMILRRANPSVPYIRFTDTANTAYGEIGVRIEGHPCFYPTIRINNGETTASWKNIYYEGADITNAAGGVFIHRANEINCFNGNLYLNHRGNGSDSNGTTGHVVMCANGGNVLIGINTDDGQRLQVAGTIRASNWFYSDGNTGWYSVKYRGGIYMEDETYVTVYNGKAMQLKRGDGSLDAFYVVNRTDTGHKIGFGIGSGGVNRGIWDYSNSRWAFYIDGNGTYIVGGNFVATGAVTFNLASDRRLKANIKPLTYRNTMRVLHRLRPVSFRWNETAVELDSSRQGLCDGFIADEYESLIPNSGRDIWEKYRAIDYTRAIPYLAKGWQIHESELDKMRGRVKDLEKEVKQLKKLLYKHNIIAA